MKRTGVTIVDPTRPGGFGDDAMCLGLADGLAATGVDDFLVLSQRRPMSHLCRLAPAGSRLRARAVRCPLRFWQLAAREVGWRLPRGHDRCALVGADLLDGHYGAHLTAFYCRTANRLVGRGVQVTVAGSSFTRAGDEALRHLRNLDPAVRLGIRDPDSLARLQAVAGPAAVEVRDVAFLLEARPGAQREAIDTFIAVQHAAGRTVIGLNVNALTVADYRAFFRPLLTLLADDPIAWLVVGHDTRPGVDDFASGHQVAAMAREMGIPVHALQRATDVREIKYTVGACDAVLTGRMHLSIAALGMGVPVVGLSYLDKFAGLFTQVGLADYLQDTATATPESVAVAVRTLVRDRAGLRDTIARRMVTVRHQAQANIAG